MCEPQRADGCRPDPGRRVRGNFGVLKHFPAVFVNMAHMPPLLLRTTRGETVVVSPRKMTWVGVSGSRWE